MLCFISIQNTPEQLDAAGVLDFIRDNCCVLTTQAESLDQVAIALDVLVLDVSQQGTTLVDQLQQPSAGVMIFLVVGEVAGQVLNTCGQQRDLDFGRTGITLGQLVFLDNLLFLFCRQ